MKKQQKEKKFSGNSGRKKEGTLKKRKEKESSKKGRKREEKSRKELILVEKGHKVSMKNKALGTKERIERGWEREKSLKKKKCSRDAVEEERSRGARRENSGKNKKSSEKEGKSQKRGIGGDERRVVGVEVKFLRFTRSEIGNRLVVSQRKGGEPREKGRRHIKTRGQGSGRKEGGLDWKRGGRDQRSKRRERGERGSEGGHQNEGEKRKKRKSKGVERTSKKRETVEGRGLGGPDAPKEKEKG